MCYYATFLIPRCANTPTIRRLSASREAVLPTVFIGSGGGREESQNIQNVWIPVSLNKRALGNTGRQVRLLSGFMLWMGLPATNLWRTKYWRQIDKEIQGGKQTKGKSDRRRMPLIFINIQLSGGGEQNTKLPCSFWQPHAKEISGSSSQWWLKSTLYAIKKHKVNPFSWGGPCFPGKDCVFLGRAVFSWEGPWHHVPPPPRALFTSENCRPGLQVIFHNRIVSSQNNLDSRSFWFGMSYKFVTTFLCKVPRNTFRQMTLFSVISW